MELSAEVAEDILNPSIKDLHWQKMRRDLGRYTERMMDDQTLMCCACGRFLPYEDFSLEHIIPQKALSDDPYEVKRNPELTVNQRGITTLLCKRPLSIKKHRVFANGCNSWKGSFYDGKIREMLNGSILSHEHREISTQHIIALLCVSYLAMVVEFGYQVALTESGRLMREQFFVPSRFHKALPIRSQKALIFPPLVYDERRADIWRSPFKFEVRGGHCFVGCRSLGAWVPISRDPRLPISTNILVTPQKYKMRPNFATIFDES